MRFPCRHDEYLRGWAPHLMGMITKFRHAVGMMLVVVLVSLPGNAAEPLKFNRDIRPILSDKCFACHGPDTKKQEAGLRLDTFEDAMTKGAIVPGDPDKSELIKRITTQDPDDHMPPAKAKIGSLGSDEIKLLRQWIKEGAKYESHWAFIPLEQPQIPKTAGVHNSRHPVDMIVASRLLSRGLKLRPEAKPEVLARRLSFDLTGLPPDIASVRRFAEEHQSDPDTAVDRYVDRLLRSPAFGERWAVDWLDVARYADSYGFQVDRERDVWMWRDWVIKAMNENLPFDKFITWQIAGDLLSNATDDQILATAFSRLHQQESEGGSVEEEYRVEYVADRVQTVATAFLGLTFECARCHDHKYDPISQRDYYGFFSMFQNIDEAGLYSYFTQSPPTPTLMLTDRGGKERERDLDSDVRKIEHELLTWKEQALKESFRYLQKFNTNGNTIPILGELARYSFDKLETNRFENSVKSDQPAVLKGDNRLVTGKFGNAVEFTGDDAVSLSLGNFRRHEPFSISAWIKTPDRKERAVVFHRSAAWTDAASRGYECLIEDGRIKWSLIHFWPGNAISIRANDPIELNQWVHVLVTSDGSSRAAGLKIFVNGKPAATQVIRDALSKDITGGGGDHITLGERFRDRGFKGGMVDDFRVFGRALTSFEASAVFDETKTLSILRQDVEALEFSTKSLIGEYLVETHDGQYREISDRLKAARAKQTDFLDSVKEIMVMREMAAPKKAYVLFRGEYNQPREGVGPGVLSNLLPLPEGELTNRLGLARWLTHPKQPLTSRVVVNRVWNSLFGRGLVKTTEDFGSQGERPMYPEVLDWISLTFIESGWDFKKLIKTIVASRVYRQDSFGEKQAMEDDPENQWLSRGPRYRLPAEMIRDSALFVSGLIQDKLGGPPVNPYEMAEAFKPVNPPKGDGVYRRSVYTQWRRTSPPPAMLAFDAPRRAVCASKRERTDSPLQALILLNGTQYVEAARVLGEKLYTQMGGDVAGMIELGFEMCWSRKPNSTEARIARRLYDEQLKHFESFPDEAITLLKIGNTQRHMSIPPGPAAAATVLAQALLNHDLSVVKR